ncbi:MAG: AAA family ATPase [Pseudomonadota bacterium]
MTTLRVGALTLAPYGRFDDRTLTFPAPPGPDLQLIVGQNEAGKTTLRHAIADALFGVPRGHPYGFSGKSRLVAEVALSDGTHRVERLGAADVRDKAARAALAEALTGVTRETFLARHAFSHSSLDAQAAELLQSKGDLRQLLEQSAGGLTAVALVRQALDDALRERFVKRRNEKKNQMRQLEAAHSAAAEAYEHAKVEAPLYADLCREAEEAARERDRVLRAVAAARAALRRAERQVARAPDAARLTALETSLRAAETAPTLAPEASAEVSAARLEERELSARLADATARADAAEAALAALPQDPAALELAPTITRFAADAARLDERTAAKADALRKAGEARRDAARRLDDAGLGPDVAAFAPEIERREARRILDERQRVERAVTDAAEAVAAVKSSKPPPVPAPVPAETLRLIARLAAHLDAGTALAAADERVRDTTARCAALTVEAAPTAPPPPASEGRARERAIEQCAARRDTLADRLQEAKEAVFAAQQAVEGHRAANLPTAEAIAAARAARDRLFDQIAAGEPVATLAEPFRTALDKADRLADERIMRSQEAAAAEADVRTLTAARETLSTRSKEHAAAEASLNAARAAWRDALAAVGLDVPADYAAWHERQSAADAARTAREEAEMAAKTLRDTLAALVVEAGGAPGADLAGAIAERHAHWDGVRAAAEAARAKAALAREAHEALVAEAPKRQAALEAAEAAAADWRARWMDAAARCRVSPDIHPARLSDLFDAQKDAADALAAADALEAEARAQEAAIAATTAEAARLCAALGEAALPPDQAAAHLVARQTAAEEAERARRLRTGERANAHEAIEAARRAILTLRAGLDPHFRAAGLAADAPLETLQAAAAQSDQRAALIAERARITQTITADGLTVEGLVASLEGEGVAGLEAAHRLAAETVEALEGAERAAGERVANADAAVARAEREGREGTAAAAFASRERIAEAMANVAEEAVALRVELALLDHAQEAFRKEHASPILSAASDIFSRFTDGAYDRLTAEARPDAYIEAHRVADDSDVTVDQLSAGTRDQLVLAVRFAAATASPLPFVADDLFVNADPDRTARGFEILGDLARGRQVFYLTAQPHLVAIAKAAVPGLSVTPL